MSAGSAPPLVSVVLPAYNAAGHIGDALESVFRQACPQLEVIVVDDGSTDATATVLRHFGSRIRVLSQENKGPSAARNKGIQAATGGLVGLLDADDLWADQHLALTLPLLCPGSPWDFVRGRTRVIHPATTGLPPQELIQPALIGACLFRRSVFDTVGGFDESMRNGGDFDWNARLAESGCREKRLDDVTLIYRRREGSLSYQQQSHKRGLFHSVRNQVARRTASAK